MTKQELSEQNITLTKKYEDLSEWEENVRKELSKLVGRPVYSSDAWGDKSEASYPTLSWIEIAFLIGELKSDADFSVILAARDQFREENRALREEIAKLSHPTTTPEK